MTTKKCSLCDEEKELTSFKKNNTKRGGLDSQCKQCVSSYRKNIEWIQREF